MLHPATSIISCHPFFLLISPDLPLVSPGPATKAANGEGMYLHTGTDGEAERAREGEGQRDTQA